MRFKSSKKFKIQQSANFLAIPTRVIEALELGTQLASQGIEDLTLKVKSTGEQKKFNLLSEEKFIRGLDNNMRRVSQYDMNKLEIEYDYDTEVEQIGHSKRMLATDLQDAIDWFVCDDPLNIVNNLRDL